MIMFGVYMLADKVDCFKTTTQNAQDIERRTEVLERDVFANLERLKYVTLETELFETEEYKRLIDVTTELPQPALSRSNPFLPTE